MPTGSVRRSWYPRVIAAGLLCFMLCSSAWSAMLVGLSTTQKPAEQKVVDITLRGQVTPKIGQLDAPRRVLIDFPHSQLTQQWHQILKQVSGIRYAQRPDKSTRVVFDMAKSQFYQGMSQRKTKDGLTVVTLRFSHINHETNTSAKTRKHSTPNPSPTLRPVTVVIDPGHGGHDPGAIGRGGIQEKRVVLAIAKELSHILSRYPGIQVTMTRSTDTYLGLRQRLDVARKVHADLFISIHSDASRNRTSRGVSIFALSQRGATSEAARWIAEKENHSALGEVDLSELADDSGVLRSVLLDLSQTATIGASLHLGEYLLSELRGIARLHQPRVEQARFVVLKSPDIPSVLVETGFISNYQEAIMLNTSAYQKKVAALLSEGVIHFLERYPPHNSFFTTKGYRYQVKSGDSLAVIAKHYQVSVNVLKAYNHLNDSHYLRSGQVIYVPKL